VSPASQIAVVTCPSRVPARPRRHMANRPLNHLDSDPETLRIAAELRDAREVAGISLEEVARYFGRSADIIRRIETGAVSLSIATLNTYAEALGLAPITAGLRVDSPPFAQRWVRTRRTREPVEPPEEWMGRWRGWSPR
jgi:transcriptional regulator with XRE-family HTH domain